MRSSAPTRREKINILISNKGRRMRATVTPIVIAKKPNIRLIIFVVFEEDE